MKFNFEDAKKIVKKVIVAGSIVLGGVAVNPIESLAQTKDKKEYLKAKKAYDDSLYIYDYAKNFSKQGTDSRPIARTVPWGSSKHKEVHFNNAAGKSEFEGFSSDNRINKITKKEKPVKITQSLGDKEYVNEYPIYKKPTQKVVFEDAKTEDVVSKSLEIKSPEIVTKTVEQKSWPENTEHSIDSQFSNIKIVYQKDEQGNFEANFYQNQKGERIPYTEKGENITKDFQYPGFENPLK